MQEVKKVFGERLGVGIDRDAPAVARKVVPVEEHGWKRSEQRVGNRAGTGGVVVLGFGADATEHRNAGAQHVHGVGSRGQLLERMPDSIGQAAQAEQARLVSGEFSRSGQLAVDQQVSHFGKLAMLSQVRNVVAAVMQVVAALANGTNGCFARRRARKRYGLLGFESRRRMACFLNTHSFDPQGERN